jgi:hypothetical protein
MSSVEHLFKELIKKNGDKVLSSKWFVKPEHTKLYRGIIKKYGSWQEFKIQNGYKLLQRGYTVDELISKYGCYDLGYIIKKYPSIYRQINRKIGTTEEYNRARGKS